MRRFYSYFFLHSFSAPLLDFNEGEGINRGTYIDADPINPAFISFIINRMPNAHHNDKRLQFKVINNTTVSRPILYTGWPKTTGTLFVRLICI